MLPRFAAENLTRIPFVNSDNINVLMMAKRIEIMEQRLASVEQLVTQPVTAVTAAVDKPNEKVTVPVHVSTGDGADAVVKQNDDGDNHAAADNLTWSVVTRKNRRPRPHSQSSVAAVPPRQPQGLHSKKILGTQQPKDGSLKSGVQIVKKSVLHVDNLHQDCTAALLTDYLKANEVDVRTVLL